MENRSRDICVPIDDLDLLYIYVRDSSSEIRKEFDNIVDAYNRIEEYWECSDWSAAYENLANNAQTMEDIVAELQSMTDKLQSIIQTYITIENANESIIDSLPYNVLR